MHNIVIGGAAGAMGPVIAWAAASGGLTLAPILLFLVIFLWTPPHFWALALCVKEDYRAVKIPIRWFVGRGKRNSKIVSPVRKIFLIIGSSGKWKRRT